MAGMRVHELAKEFDMTSKELLARLAEMKIPAKSHASILQDAYVEKIRKNLEPELKQRAGKLDDEEAKKLAEEQAQAEAKKAQEEAERRAAVEAEKAAREAERARRESKQASSNEEENSEEAPAEKKAASPYESLASQIERERERVERESQERRNRERAEARAAEVAKKKAVEEALQNRKNGGAKAAPQQAPKPASKPKAAPSSTGTNFSSLLDQINNERERLAQQKNEQAHAKKNARGKKQRKSFEPEVPELETQEPEQTEDRYSQMAVQAEKFQRDKVLAEARAAVEAASHDGQGRRKSAKKSARPKLVSAQNWRHSKRA